MDILVIPDSHASPKHNNDRYTWAGRLIADRQPDIVVELGDFGDYESLCSHVKGTIYAEGNRLKDDMEATRDARMRLMEPLFTLQNQQRRNKEKIYRPRLVHTKGNHEAPRWDKLVSKNPELQGLITDDLGWAREFGWESYEYQQIVTIENIDFSHNFVSGAMGRPIFGEYPAAAILRKRMRSSVCGHDHRWDASNRPDAGVATLVAGCYFDYHMDYAGQANKRWWKGLTMLRDVHNGWFHVEQIPIERVKSEYGGS